MSDTRESAWWGSVAIDEGQCLGWSIGPTRLWIERRPSEWRLLRRQTDNPHDPAREVAVATAFPAIETTDLVDRFARPTTSTIDLQLRLGDRPIVARPEVPFHLAPGCRVDVFISSPLWLALSDANGVALFDFPLFRPSDTWFGPSRMSGELCYATRTYCHLQSAELDTSHFRAATAMTIHNASSKSMSFKRIRLPMPQLSLFESCDGRPWTENVMFELADDTASAGASATLEIVPGPPLALEGCKQIAKPRRREDGNIVLRALSALFSEG